MAESNIHSTKTIQQNLYDKNSFDNAERLNDIFDIINDDEQDDTEEVENITEEYNTDFDFDYINTNVDDEEMMMMIEDEKIVEGQILSQKLSQLSTKDENNDREDNEDYSTSCNQKRQLSTPSTPDVISKKHRVVATTTTAAVVVVDEDDDNDNDENQKDDIPDYLKATNKIFDKMIIEHNIHKNLTTITIEDLRRLAILKHKIVLSSFRKKLWLVYLKLGTGQWETQKSRKTNVDRRIWPTEVKKLMLSKKSNAISINEGRDVHTICEILVHEYLDELNCVSEQSQQEFNTKKNDFMDYTDDIDKIIETFIQQHAVRPLQMKFDYKIAILEYDYDAEILDREYSQLEPTKYQIQQAKCLYHLRSKYLESTQKLIELKQRILCNKPTKAMIPTSSSSNILDPIMNEQVHQQEKEKNQEKLTDSLIASIMEVEDLIHEYRELFDEEIRQICVNDKNENEGLTGKLVDLIYRRFKIMNKKIPHIFNFRINYYLRTCYGDFEDTQRNKSPFAFSPTMIIDTSLHQLTDEQIRLLNRGPTYIPLCQMYVSSLFVSINDMIQKQYKLLQHHLRILFEKTDINTARSMFINKEIKDEFIDCFSISLPISLYQRALYEQQVVDSIRKHLKVNNLILRRLADQTNVFYLGNRKDFDEKANEFMTTTDVFEVDQIVDNNNLQQTKEYLSKMIKLMNSEMDKIFSNKEFYKQLIKYLYIDVSKVQLPYLYFLPDVSKKNNTLSVKPIVVSQQCNATSRLGQFLDGLIRPVVQRQTEAITFMNGADFIRKLDRYTNEQRRFGPRTMFITMNISNYYTSVSHTTMLVALDDFLRKALPGPVLQDIPIKRIIDLATLFLNNNRFYHDNKIYRFIKGSPTSMAFTETLCHIYSLQWQKKLLSNQLMENECYGQCKNQIFSTWNGTIDQFRPLFQTIGREYPNIRIHSRVAFKIAFLSAYIENQKGILYTRVDHDSNYQKYTLPYVIGDTKVAHSHWFRSALIRAARYCTSVYDFNQERIYLEITCLTNGYSLEFIEQRINHFFIYFDVRSLRLSLDQKVYDKLRLRLFNFISEQRQFLNKNQELENNDQRFKLSYLYQYGSKHKFNKKLQTILSKALYTPPPTPSTDNKIRIILSTKQQYSLNALLSQQKPFHTLLHKS